MMVGGGATHVFEQFQNGVLGNPVMRQVALIDVPSTRACIGVGQIRIGVALWRAPVSFDFLV
jgi:hypothetical protein